MANISVPRVSPLEGCYSLGNFGNNFGAGITFREMKNLQLFQIATWPESLNKVGLLATKIIGGNKIPTPNKSILKNEKAILRVEPLKFLLVGCLAPRLEPSQGSILDLSHSCIHLRISGSETTTLLNRYLPIDLRDDSFQIGCVASTAFHHVGVILWRSNFGFELFLPRGFAVSLWNLLTEGAGQFGYEVI